MRPRVTSVGLFMPARPAPCADLPLHIDRASLEALPSRPGVYLFLDGGGAPLYIGKSVNIRARVFSHLRAAEEAAMLLAARRVECIRTAGEIGALLLEAHLVKKFQPAYNVLLKSAGPAWALRLAKGETRPSVVASFDPAQDGGEEALHGLFASRTAAEAGLRLLARRHGLCPALLGFETTIRGRACFSHQIGQCRGACIGLETDAVHHRRLRRALRQLQAEAWPHAGPVGILETDDGWRQIHVVDRWRYLGFLSGRQRRLRIAGAGAIDMDIHRILAQPMQRGELTLVPAATVRGFLRFDF